MSKHQATTTYRSEMGLHYCGDLSDFDDRTDRLMDALMGMEGIVDPDISVNLATGDVIVTMIVREKDVLEAGRKVHGTVRSAIHEIGDSTEGWDKLHWDDPADLNVSAIRDEKLISA